VAGLDRVDNPLGVEALQPVRRAAQALLAVALPALALAGLASLVARWRAADLTGRRQVGWFGYGLAVTVVAAFVTSGWLLHLLSLALPVGIAVAVVRWRLYGIEALVDRTLAGAVLVTGAAVVYSAVVGWAGALSGRQGAGAGLRRRRRRRPAVRPGPAPGGDGGRPDAARPPGRPVRPAHRRRRLAAGQPVAPSGPAAGDPGGARRAAAARRGAAGPAARRRRGGGAGRRAGPPGAARGRPALARRAARRARGGRPAGEAELEPPDRRLLGQLAGQLAAVAYALRLTADLEDGRRALVEGVAEERRRLRRDLHDGLGPQLAAVALGVSTAERALARADADRAAALLRGARDQLEGGVAEVRRLVHGLRPPALDDLGLLDALRTTGPAASGELAVRFAVDGDLTGLPAAVEVAAYRIVQEALTNVLRHADVTAATVRLTVLDGALEVAVEDAGRGIPAQRTAGVGTTSMRERAEELGGTYDVSSAPGAGPWSAAGCRSPERRGDGAARRRRRRPPGLPLRPAHAAGGPRRAGGGRGGGRPRRGGAGRRAPP
jgi:signal transduction histidine kinase